MAGIVGGLAIGQFHGIPPIADSLLFPFLVVMLFAAFAGIPPATLREALGKRRVLGSSLGVNFLWNPLLAVVLGATFLVDHPALRVGLLTLLVTPCTDWYLIFTALANGNVPLATALLPYSLVLQFVLLPSSLYLFADTLVDLQVRFLLESVLLVLLVPVILAIVIRRVLVTRTGETWFEDRFRPILGSVRVVFLSLAMGRFLEFSYGELACVTCTIHSKTRLPRWRSPSSPFRTNRSSHSRW